MQANFITTNLLFVPCDMPINAVVSRMIERKISSALVIDKAEMIVGIVTERDIVRKFTLLDFDQKWNKKICTIMTREVCFANLQTLKEDLINLHFRQGFRHYPVLLAPGAKKENVIGMVTVTDLCREYLMDERRMLALRTEKRLLLIPAEADGKHVMTKLLSGLGYDVQETKMVDQMFTPGPETLPLVVDLEGMDFLARDTLLGRLKNYRGSIIVLTPERPVHGALNKFCSLPGKTMITKPVDISYLNWVLARAYLPLDKAS